MVYVPDPTEREFHMASADEPVTPLKKEEWPDDPDFPYELYGELGLAVAEALKDYPNNETKKMFAQALLKSALQLGGHEHMHAFLEAGFVRLVLHPEEWERFRATFDETKEDAK